jgi:Flp pilus assembly protein TadD
MALAMVYQQNGRDRDAVNQYRALLRQRPGDPVASNNLAWLLATSSDSMARNPQEAVTLAELVCQKSRRQLPSALDTLAAAYFAAGRPADAAQAASEAVRLLEENGSEAAAVNRIRSRLRQYQQSVSSARE